MTNLSPLWVKKVTPVDDGFIPYVAPSEYQYKPNLVPTYPQPQQYTFDTPRTTRAVALGIEGNQQAVKAQHRPKVNKFRKNHPAFVPMGPDIPYRDYQYDPLSKTANSPLPMGPDIRYRGYGRNRNSRSKVSSVPMGPDIPYRDYRNRYPNARSGRASKSNSTSALPMGPDIRYRETKYRSPDSRLGVTSSVSMGPDIQHRDYVNRFTPIAKKTRKRVAKPAPKPQKAQKNRNVQIKEGAAAYKGYEWADGRAAVGVAATAAATQPIDDWKRPYELAGEAAVLSWIRMQEEYKRRGNRHPGYAFSRYEITDNPTGARESLRRTYDYHGADF